MIHGSTPSKLFCDAILAGYQIEATAEDIWRPMPDVTVSGIWNQIVRAGLQKARSFEAVFAWDVRCQPSQRRNRIADIAEAIRQGYVPGLRLATNAKGREIVTDG
jgi:hypothetical protein